MGWKNSPPFFCAFTETGADIANAHLTATLPMTMHPLESFTQTMPFPWASTFAPTVHHPCTTPPPQPLSYVGVYIDDFLALAQLPTMHATMRTLLHSIGDMFQDSQQTPRRAVISSTKLEKGTLPGPHANASWVGTWTRKP